MQVGPALAAGAVGAAGCSARAGGCTNSERPPGGLTPPLVCIVVAKCARRGCCTRGELAISADEGEEKKQNLTTREPKLAGLFVRCRRVSHGTTGGQPARAARPLNCALLPFGVYFRCRAAPSASRECQGRAEKLCGGPGAPLEDQ